MTSTTAHYLFRTTILACFSFLIANVGVAQNCAYNVTLADNGATCLQNDTLTLRGASPASRINWYRGTDSVGVATLAPYTMAGRKTGDGSGIAPDLLSRPQSVCMDRAGNIYIADADNHRIQKWAPGAAAGVTVAGGVGFGEVNNRQVINPFGIFVDTAGNLYVSDQALNRVLKWAPGDTAGTLVAGANFGQSGTGAKFLSGPWGIYVTRRGDLYVCDMFNYRVQLWTPFATEGITVAGGNGYGDAANQLAWPSAVFVDDNDNVYVADANNNRVQKWLPGAASGITVAGGNGAGNAANQLNFPSGISVDNNGTLFIADQSNSRIQKWLPGAVSGITVAGGNGVGTDSTQVSSPSALWLDSAKNMFICDVVNHRVQQWKADSSYGTTVAGSKIGAVNINSSPLDVAVDKSGNVYLAEGMSSSVLKFTPGNANGVIVAGGHGQGNAANQFSFPQSVFVDSNNVVYVVDATNNRVQKWLPGADSGVTVAGGNGPGSAANQLNAPYGLYVDEQGNVFVTDTRNYRVQKWAPGAVSGITVAGGNGFGSNANQLMRPVDVAVTKNGDVYVMDNLIARVQKWLPGATQGITVAGGDNNNGVAANQLYNAYGIFIDDSLNILIADGGNHRIQQWHAGADSAITLAGSAGNYGSLNDQLKFPASVCKDKSGNLYIVDVVNNRLQKWPNVVDSTFQPTGPGLYTAVVTGRNPVCTTSSNGVSVNTGYTYQFNGSGNWSSPANWFNGNFPPEPLPACSKIIVSPSAGGTCILDVPQTISIGANLTIATGTNFIINGNLTVQ